MKKIFLSVIALAIAGAIHAQNLKPVAQKIHERKMQTNTFSKTQLFKISESLPENLNDNFYDSGETVVLDLQIQNVEKILAERTENIQIEIPYHGGQILKLDLFRSNIFTPDFKVSTSGNNGMAVPYEGGVHYWGIIDGDNNSLAALSIFENEVMGMISSASTGNLNLGKIEHDAQSRHILFQDQNLKANIQTDCFTANDNDTYLPGEIKNPSPLSVDCIRLYWEVNYDIYQGKGSVANATNYVTGVFNQSAIIFTNDNIPVSLNQVFVWNTTSPYTSTSTSGLLGQFQSFRNSFDGDLGHLLGYVGGGGIAAGFNGLCASNLDNSQCYSGISSSYSNFPTYSWTVMVVTHEQGHLMGSRHTHACVWNGNNTAIDNCGPSAGYGYEGSCSGAPSPGATGGTIMSYCHLVGGVGIKFNNGFGAQPAAAILAKYNSAACLTACGTSCGTPNGLNVTNVTQTSATLNWGSVTGASTYNLQHKETAAPNWTTVTGLVNPTYNLSGLNQATSYQFQVQTVCTGGISNYSSPYTFTTAAPPCSIATGVTAGNVTVNSALISWNAAAGASTYNLQYYPTGTQNFMNINGITGTSQPVSNLLPNTSYSVRIQTVCTGSFSNYTSPVIFSTLNCDSPPNPFEKDISSTSVKLKWTKITGAISYKINYREAGTTGWINKYTTSNTGNKIISGLNPNTSYEWRVRTKCTPNPGPVWSAWTTIRQFTTSAGSPARKVLNNFPESQLIIAPNPVQDMLHILIDPDASVSQIVISDQAGRVISNNVPALNTDEGMLSIDVINFPNGIYFVKIFMDAEILNGKFVVMH